MKLHAELKMPALTACSVMSSHSFWVKSASACDILMLAGSISQNLNKLVA